MTEFEWGLAIGSILGIVFGISLAVVLIKVEARRERRMGYVTWQTYGTGYAKPYDENPERKHLGPPSEGIPLRRSWFS